MKSTNTIRTSFYALILASASCVVACGGNKKEAESPDALDNDDAMEEAGEDVDESMEEAGEAMDEAADDAEDAVDGEPDAD